MVTGNKLIRHVITKAIDPAEDWELMSRCMVRPEEFKPEDFRTFETTLCNNLVDRERERFTKQALEVLAATLPDKSKLESHNWRDVGNGRFYFAVVEPIPEGDPAWRAKYVREIVQRDGGLFWLRARFYMLADNPRVREIAAGIGKDMSIGFINIGRQPVYRGDLWPGDPQPKILVWTEFVPMEWTEAVEGSTVVLGSQLWSFVRKEVTDVQGQDAEDNCEREEPGAEKREVMAGQQVPDVGFGAALDCSHDMSDANDQLAFGDVKEVWSRAYINSLPNNCFAVVENTGEEDQQGRVLPPDARHLPHHKDGDGHPGGRNILDMPHFRAALARWRQIKSVTGNPPTRELRELAWKHLKAHLDELREKGVAVDTEDFLVEVDVAGRKFEVPVDDWGIKDFASDIEQMIAEERDMTKDFSDALRSAREEVEAFKKEFGEDVGRIREWRREAEKRKQWLVSEVLRFAVLAGAIDRSEAPEKRALYEAMSPAELEDRLAEYQKLADANVRPRGELEKSGKPVDVNIGFYEEV